MSTSYKLIVALQFTVFCSFGQVRIDMVRIEGGTFQMGSTSGRSNEKPLHSVTVNAFEMGKYEITQGQWKAVMGNNPSSFSVCDNCPVENVSWNEVQNFIKKLNAQTKKNYRLPTEAEWEFAARGGKKSRSYIYSGSNDVNIVAWFLDNSESKMHQVGTRQPNELGLYDMTGNVSEWCSDWYGAYVSSPEVNPKGSAKTDNLNQEKVIRGSTINTNSPNSKVTMRMKGFPSKAYATTGFRLVLAAGI